jgi:dihydroxyacetone kinase
VSGAAVVRDGLARAVATLAEHEAELGRLDAALGDGDHGSGVLRGFRAAQAAADASDGSAGELLVAAGAALADAAGGASGAIYGALLQGAGTALGTDDACPAVAALRAGLTLVERLGKAQVGDKTLVDVLDPFVESLERESADGRDLAQAWQAALPAARAGLDSTVDLVARRGRAAKLGERGRGHADPGATSLFYILTAFRDALVAGPWQGSSQVAQ